MMNKFKVPKLFVDIRFWIAVFFFLRLYGITNPPLEVGHNWRQTTVTMVSRNFLEIDNNIFYPRLDFAGDKTGITGMEFPLLNYLIYIISKVFGYQHWYGRLINLIISSLGLWFFYKLIRKYFSEKHSLYSTIILAVSVWFQFSRKIMPDTFAMSFVLASIYYGTNYLEEKSSENKYLQLLLYFFLMMLGGLSKLPSVYLLIVFGILFLDKQISLKRKIIFAAISLIGLIPIGLWYFYWTSYLVEKYEFWHFFLGKSFAQAWSEILDVIPETLYRFYCTALKYIGFLVFIFGLIMSFIRKATRVYLLFFVAFLGFTVILLKSGSTFANHNYYIIPFVPVMAMVAGYGLMQLKLNYIAVFFLLAVSIEGIVNQEHDFRVKEKDYQLCNLEKDLDLFSERSDLILINSGKYPTPMYFSHRKGWINYNNIIQDENYISGLKVKGLKYIVILKRAFGSEIGLPYKKLFDNKDYCIYQL